MKIADAIPAQVFGVLTSQVGYEPDETKHAVVRSHDPAALAPDTAFTLTDAAGATVHRGRVEPWGRLWSSHWWIADFSAVRLSGLYHLHFVLADGGAICSDPIRIEVDVRWQRSFEAVALSQLERRARFAEMKLGWMDAGMPWQEANAHGSMLAALCDVLDFARRRLTLAQETRLLAQLDTGCAYLDLLQDEARTQGLPAGSLSHMKPRFETQAITADAAKAAVAWARTARLHPRATDPQRHAWQQRAAAALDYCDAQPPDNQHGFNIHQRGLPETYQPPAGQHMTRELWTQAWASIELARQLGGPWWNRAVIKVDAALARQARPDEAIADLHGWFYEFDDRHHFEPTWAHQIRGRPLGVDAGATFPFWVLPLIDLLELQPDHPQAGRWRSALEQFVQGFLLPACARNPFWIAPLMLTHAHGLIWFAGPWHGMNCLYGLTAYLARRLHRVLPEPRLLDVATANVQWIAGLNAGLTRQALLGCHQFDADLPAGLALPVSMIHGIGERIAGGWTNIRGSVCNGFAVGDQFVFDIPPSPETDGPHQLTDEDWIPHAAGWLSALSVDTPP